LKNSKWETFARHCAASVPAHKAYELAGYKPNRGNTTRLKKKECVAERISFLSGAVAERAIEEAAVTKGEVIEKLRATYVHATNDGQHSAAAKSTELLGKTLAMFTDVKEEKTTLSDDELIEKVRRILDERGK